MHSNDLLFDALLTMGQTLNLKQECINLTAIFRAMGYSYVDISVEDGDFYESVTFQGNCNDSRCFKLDLENEVLPNKPVATVVLGKETEFTEQELKEIKILIEKFKNVIIACLCRRQAAKEINLRQKTEKFLKEAKDNINQLAMEKQEITKELDAKIKEHTQEFQKVINSLKELALKDPMTGLFNKRQILELGEEMFKDAVAHCKNFAVIMMDIDNFKDVNDNFGHIAGDQVIEILGKRLKNLIRGDDLAGRYGGEEFIFFLSCDKATVKAVGERLRSSIASQAFVIDNNKKLFITVSLGVAFRTLDDRHFKDILKRADEMLYKAKRTGKNKVIVDWEND